MAIFHRKKKQRRDRGDGGGEFFFSKSCKTEIGREGNGCVQRPLAWLTVNQVLKKKEEKNRKSLKNDVDDLQNASWDAGTHGLLNPSIAFESLTHELSAGREKKNAEDECASFIFPSKLHNAFWFFGRHTRCQVL